MNSSLSPSTSLQNCHSEPESSIIQKQRKELQLLIAELKERDKELNEMVAVHQRQLLAWEDDRQKILTLAERCNRTENELLKRNEMITTLTHRLKLHESQEGDWKRNLEDTRKELEEASRTAFDASLHCRGLEEKNQALNCSVVELSNRVGQLQVREQELLTMLKLKDKDILEATNQITDFTCKFKTLENALRLAKVEESNINKEKQEFKRRLKELMVETSKLTDDLSEKTKENNEQREEIIRLKQEISYLNNELLCSVETASRKDHLLQSAKSKQLRTDTELSNLRQIYVKQQQDLQFLHFNLESSQDTKPKTKEAHEASVELVLSDLENSRDSEAFCSETTQKTHTRFTCLPPSLLQTTCFMCEAKNRQQALDAGSRERLSANSGAFQEGTCCCSETPPREELRRDSAWMKDGRELVWATEQKPVTSLPVHEHWLGLDSFAEPTGGRSPTSKLSERFDRGCQATGADRLGIGSGQKAPNSPRPAKALDPSGSGCRSENITDQEWMRIFKPAAAEGGTKHGDFYGSSQGSCRTKSTKAESSHNADLTLSDLGSPRLTSTQKTSGAKRHEKILVLDRSPRLASVPEVQESCSPMSKLQRRLVESQQILADLERNYLRHKAPGCCPQDGNTPVSSLCLPSKNHLL